MTTKERLDDVYVPGTWKVWVRETKKTQPSAAFYCLAIFNHNEDAHIFVEKMKTLDARSRASDMSLANLVCEYLVTPHATVGIKLVEEKQ